MFDLSSLLISSAMAAEQAPVTVEAVAEQSGLVRFLPFFLILGVFYFILIRPQQQKLDAQEKMLKELKKGDKVYVGGMVGVVVRADEGEYLMVEIAKDVQVKVLRTAVSGLVPAPLPANSDKKD